MDVALKTTYEEKIEEVLKKLLDPTFKIRNDVYLNSLLTHITKYQENAEPNPNVNLTNTFSNWIIHAITKWEESKQKVSADIFSFTLNLASFISKDEMIFGKLNSLNVYERLLQIIHVPSGPPIIKLGFINLISSFLQHKSGLQWIVASNYWNNIISLTLNAHTMYIKSAGCKFITELLDKTINLDETFCQNVVKTLIEPLDSATANIPNGNSLYSEVKNDAIAETLFPTLRMLTDVLHTLLERTNMDVTDIFVKDFKLVCKIKTLLLVCQTEDFEFELRKVMFLIGFIDLYNYFSGFDTIMYAHVTQTREEGIFENIKALIRKGYVKSVLKLCHTGLTYWRSIGHKMPKCFQRDQQIELEVQLMIIQIIPIMIAGANFLGLDNFERNVKLDSTRDDYVSRTLKVSGTITIKAGYQWRQFLLEDPNIIDDTTLALMFILKSKSFYTREGGVLTFQACIYSLKDIINYMNEGPPNMELLWSVTKFLELLLEAIGVFIEEFHITWKDTIESMCAMILAVELLHTTIWTPKVVIKAFNLLNITISKYMSPTMALLEDTTKDRSLAAVGTLLYAKCHDPSWEVRDSSLEVLCTMSLNANTKFPSFQKIILEADLPHLLVKMAVSDSEPFVRASALKCLQEMIQVQDFWENLLTVENLHGQFFDIISKETEGIVRKEATTLVCKIYDHQTYPEVLLPNLYDVMTHAAISDLHWEVKVNALNFWQTVVKKHLQNQGMIDGTFPKVTFSKENRKIVNLNDLEVQKRLVKVLNRLSENGCLAVFVAAIQDDCDIQVAKSATEIANNFVKLLKRYDITANNSNLSQPPSPLIHLPCLSSEPFYGNSQQADHSVSSTLLHNNPVAQDLNTSNTLSNIQSIDHNHSYPLPDSPFSLISQDHEVFSPNCDSSLTDMEYQDVNVMSVEASQVTDEILEQILNASDVNLLKPLYNPNDNIYGDGVSLRKKTVLSPSDFIRFTFSNLESNLLEKSKWLNGIDDFGSLLDDILREYNVNDINSMDCY